MYYVSFCCDNHFYEMLFNERYELEVYFACLYKDYHIIEIFDEVESFNLP